MTRSRQQQQRQQLNRGAMPLSSSWIIYASLVALSLLLGRATAQEELAPLCSCSPSKYSFTLDFSLLCPPVNVTKNAGISATFCQISPFGDPNQNITDLVPVQVEYVDVLELGQNFEVMTQANITGTFKDGDSFDYTSIVAQDETSEQIPKVIQLNIFAFNAAKERIVNFYAIAFSNICDEYPTLIEGESAGWTQFTKLEEPLAELCPAVAVPTETPRTSPPTIAPVVAVSDSPSSSPVDATDAPTTSSPTIAPVAAVSDSPSSSPVDATDTPTTPSPTIAPVAALTDSPTSSPIDDTDEPTTPSTTIEPVAAVTDSPTSSPVDDTDAPTTPSPTIVPVAAVTDSPIAELTMPPTMMSMDMSMSLDDLDSVNTDEDAMMSMDMSMSMDSIAFVTTMGALLEEPSRIYLRNRKDRGDKMSKLAEEGFKSPKTAKGMKFDKSLKIPKVDKESKYGDTSNDKGFKSSKESKEESFFKKGKASKEEKNDDTGRRRRRLRVHRVN